MKAPAGFDLEKHRKYVENGKCPYVQDKVYCNDITNHAGVHWATFQVAYGRTKIVPLPNAVVYEETT